MSAEKFQGKGEEGEGVESGNTGHWTITLCALLSQLETFLSTSNFFKTKMFNEFATFKRDSALYSQNVS